MSGITGHELHIAEVVVRGGPLDAFALPPLIGERQAVVLTATAEHLGDRLFVQRSVLRVVIARLQQVSVEQVDIIDADTALMVVDMLEQARRTPLHPAEPLTPVDLATIGAVLRGELVPRSDLGLLLGYAPSMVHRVMDMVVDADGARDIVVVLLLLRLRGQRVDLRELASALHAVQTVAYKQAVERGEIRP